MPSAQILEQKKAVVEALADKMSHAAAGVLVKYQGITVEDDTKLRAALRAAGVDFKVYKNTLIKLALKEQGIEGLDEHLNGSTAVAFSYDDPTAAAKVITKFINKVKKTGKDGVLKFGKWTMTEEMVGDTVYGDMSFAAYIKESFREEN